MRKTKKKKDRWFLWVAVALCLLLVGALLLPRLWMRPAPAGMVLTNTTKPVVGADAGVSVGRSYCDQGIFMLSRSNTLMRFFEYETGKTYVMCGESSCLHNGPDCPAWYDPQHPTQGLAAYGGSIYAVIWNDARSAYELCTMQLDGTGRKALATLPDGSVTLSNGTVAASTVTDVVYSGGHAWITVSETREAGFKEDLALGMLWNFSRYYGVELSSGRLFEVKVSGEGSYGSSARFERATDDTLIFCATQKEPMLSEAEFNEARSRGEYAEIAVSEQFPDLYDAYRFAWEQEPTGYTYYRYDIGSGELTALESGVCIHGNTDPHMFMGEYDGMYYVEDHSDEYKTIDSDPNYEWDKQNRNFLWDLETGEQIDLFRGPITMSSQYNDMTGHITAEGLIFYRKYLEDKRIETYAYSLETGESRYLYTYDLDDGVPFEIYSETPTQFIGCYRDKLCAIDKEDYMNGDFKKSKNLGAP